MKGINHMKRQIRMCQRAFGATAVVTATVRALAFISFLSIPASPVYSAHYYVAPNGKDENRGSIEAPFRTIQRAADTMQPGDACYVRGGTYREWVKPPRGGDLEERRIVYKAYPGETPIVKGSERIATWKKKPGGSTLTAEIPDTFFGAFNPYVEMLRMGREKPKHHLGDVYLDGKSLHEFTAWSVSRRDGVTTIECDFGAANPNERIAEIAVRQSVFRPVKPNAAHYVTIDGFILQHAATPLAEFGPSLEGLLSPWGGTHWIVQNCRISDAMCCGITLTMVTKEPYGALPGVPRDDHIVRHNVIERCGQCAINGETFGSVIEGNLLQHINYREYIHYYEAAAIKLHYSVDTLIKGNIFRHLRSKSEGMGAIWMDCGCQNNRVTGNLIYELGNVNENIYFENNHGPNLVDNNIVMGQRIRAWSDYTCYIHNLFVGTSMLGQKGRGTAVWYPHTKWFIPGDGGQWGFNFADLAGSISFNNIFVDGTNNGAQRRSDFNVFYGKVEKSEASKRGSISVSPFVPTVSVVDDPGDPQGAVISCRFDEAPRSAPCPLITGDFIGVHPIAQQRLEDRDSNPIVVDRDFLGNLRDKAHPVAGPFEVRDGELHTFRISAGPGKAELPTRAPLPNRLTIAIAATADDAEEQGPQGEVRLDGKTLGLGSGGGDTDTNRLTGLRFANVFIPRGASIESAHVQFIAAATGDAEAALTIRGLATDDVAPFKAEPRGLSARPTSIASISWKPQAWKQHDGGSGQRTPDMREIVQELVDGKGWSSGNAMGIVVTGTGGRVAEGYADEESPRSELRILWTPSSHPE
jgi:hypothetical protein